MSRTGIEMGTCPVCNGTGGVGYDVDPDRVEWGRKRGWYGYDPETDTVECVNCGGQYQTFKPGRSATGKVRLRPDGTPCVHSYMSENIGRCYNKYICRYCGDTHNIDSGD